MKTLIIFNLLLLLAIIDAPAQHILSPAFISSGNANNSLNTDEKAVYSWYKPPVYILSVMTIDLGFLLATGMADDKIRSSNFKKAFTMPPVWDDDAFWVNYISHPLMGSESYLRGRESGYGWFGSFLFSTGMSLTWEYLMESWTERPSINDMLVTSTLGSLLGELRYFAKSKINSKFHWTVDPINSLLIAVFPSKENFSATMQLSFNF